MKTLAVVFALAWMGDPIAVRVLRDGKVITLSGRARAG